MSLRISWVTRSFLDYRLPVFEQLDRLSGNNLSVIYFAEVVPEHCQERLREILGERALGLRGEIRLSGKKRQPLAQVRGNGLRIPLQPGLIETLRRSRPEVIIADGFFQWTYAALWLRLFQGIPLVMCYEGTPHTESNAGRLRTWYRRLVSKAMDRIVCNGQLSQQYIEDLGYPRERIRLGNMAADIRKFERESRGGAKGTKEILQRQWGVSGKTLLFVGRMVPLKGIDRLLEAWKEAFGGQSEPTLLLVGDGPQKKELLDYCQGNGLINVRFVGAVAHKEIPAYFALADVFIIPTLRDNWSLVVPEAMASGLPIACSRYNGCWPELVYASNGWVFDPLDRENLVVTLLKIMGDAPQWPSMGRASREIVQRFSPEKIAQGLFAACTSLNPQERP